MNDICVSWHRNRYCYAHEQCRLATRQWSRLLDSMLSVGLVKASPFCGPSIDPCLTRLVNSADYDPVISRGSARSDTTGTADSESVPCKHCCSDEESGTRHGLRRNGFTPWKSDVRIYSPGIKGLNEEIEDFYSYMCPLPEERLMRQKVIERVTALVTELWPSAKVDVFGSFATGLYLPTSDIDLVVQWDMDTQSQPEMMQNALVTLEKQLLNKGIYADVKVIRTSVPIVKFTDCETAIKIDVGFSASISTGIQSVHFIKEQMREYPLIRCLVVVLKQFLIYHNLLESFNGGISSYCLILLILSYLQMNVDEDYSNTGHHLIRFLELYGCQFNYLRTGIRIRDGGSYFRKNDGQAGEFENRYQYSLLCIEDPLNAANDVGQGCYGAMKVRDAFANAYRELRDAVLPQYEHIQSHCASFLGRILLVPLEVVKYRHVIQKRWQLQPGSSSSSSSTADDPSSCSEHLPSAAAVGVGVGVLPALLTQIADDKSDSGSCSSRTSNLSSLTKSSGVCASQSPGSTAALSDAESDGVLSDTNKSSFASSWRAVSTSSECATTSSLQTSVSCCSESVPRDRIVRPVTAHSHPQQQHDAVTSHSGRRPPSYSSHSQPHHTAVSADNLTASSTTATATVIYRRQQHHPTGTTTTTSTSRPATSTNTTTTSSGSVRRHRHAPTYADERRSRHSVVHVHNTASTNTTANSVTSSVTGSSTCSSSAAAGPRHTDLVNTSLR